MHIHHYNPIVILTKGQALTTAMGTVNMTTDVMSI